MIDDDDLQTENDYECAVIVVAFVVLAALLGAMLYFELP
jgi:hypothetical protein